MKFSYISSRITIFTGICFTLLFLFSKQTLAYDFSSWSHGASGYEEAMYEAENNSTPLIVYFHTEWCKWSQKMNANYLDSDDVSSFLDDFQKVEINPETGDNENALKNQFNITGYPTFLVYIPSLNSTPEKVYPFRKGSNWSTDKFISTVREKMILPYNKKAFSCFQNKEYEDAIEYYDMAIQFDPENVYAYFGKGLAQYAVAYENQDAFLFIEAEASYMKVLELDPGHKESKNELGKLQKTMESLGMR